MKPRHQVSRAAIELIEGFEGYRRKAAQLPDGRWTIGYGHTLTARRGAEVSHEDAEALLLYDLIAVAKAVNELTYTPLTQNQFDALCAFAFNIGLENFRGSAVLKRVNEGALLQAAFGMELWRRAEFEGEDIVVDALVRRRAAEKALFLTPPGGVWVAAPSPVLPPHLDAAAPDVSPREPAWPVETSLEGERVVVLRDGEPAPPPVPPPEDRRAGELGRHPVTAAAEAVTARLAAVFADEPAPPPEPVPEGAAPEPADAMTWPDTPPAPVEPESIAPTEEPFVLTAPEPDDASPEEVQASGPQVEPSEPEPDLFDPPPADHDRIPDPPQDDDVPPIPERRVVIDDIAPFDFVPARVQALPDKPREGLLSLFALGVVGLAFFAGGLFWAANARPGAEAFLDPRWVGGLACFAGVSFFSIAVYLLLQRLGRAAEREDPRRRR